MIKLMMAALLFCSSASAEGLYVSDSIKNGFRNGVAAGIFFGKKVDEEKFPNDIIEVDTRTYGAYSEMQITSMRKESYELYENGFFFGVGISAAFICAVSFLLGDAMKKRLAK